MKYHNNPLNIRYKERNNWQGQTKPVKGFCTFKTLFYGYRAAIMLIIRYRSFGCDTVRSIINRWAPSSDNNNTQEYIAFVADSLCVSPDHVVTNDDLYLMLSAMTRIEQGSFSVSTDKALQNTLFLMNLPCILSPHADIF